MKLQRHILGQNGEPTLGTMTSNDGKFKCETLERSVDGDHPCIPAGSYQVALDVHHPGDAKGYPCPELRGVAGRDQIQIHVFNKPSESLGCIAPGERIADDGLSIESSKHAFDRLMAYLGDAFPFTLGIVDPVAELAR